jgi:hypothetical protein
MKHLLLAFFLIGLLVSCKKEFHPGLPSPGYWEKVTAGLKDSLSEIDFTRLDFARALLCKSNERQLYFLRVPFKHQNRSEDFLIVKTHSSGAIESGRIVHLKREGGGAAHPAFSTFTGSITIHSLRRQPILTSSIRNGYITALHPKLFSRAMVLPDEDVLPEVVVVAYINQYDAFSYSTWLLLNNLFDYSAVVNESAYSSGLYGWIDEGGGDGGYPSGNGGASSGSSPTPVPVEDLMEFEAESIYQAASKDVWKLFNCFNTVPSAGATYSIKLCVDIPSNNNPDASSTNSGTSAGHTFLSITKANGPSKVTQSFGFYPESAPSFLNPFGSLKSTIRDNGSSEYNAALEMTLSEGQFNLIKNNAINWSTLSYNLASYNCTNYALDIFNSVRSTPISIRPYEIILPDDPDTYAPQEPITITIDKSPQMLFRKLQEMKKNNAPEAAAITIDPSHASLSPVSYGECY